MAKLSFDEERCKGCELCTAACPRQIVVMSNRFNGKGYRLAACSDETQCLGCQLCAKACPDVVIKIYQ